MTREQPVRRTLVLARHGQTAANVAARIDTVLPGEPLTDEGREQASALGDMLADKGSELRLAIGAPVSVVYHSRADRARSTASLVAQRLGLEPVEVEGVHEVQGGDLEGAADDESRQRYRDVTRLWYQGKPEQPIPGGESGVQVLDRYLPTVDRILADHPGEVVLLVSHASAIRWAAFSLARNLDEEFVTTHYLHNCSTVVLVEDDDGWRCIRFHDAEIP